MSDNRMLLILQILLQWYPAALSLIQILIQRSMFLSLLPCCRQINVLQSHGQSSHESVLIPNGYAMRIMRASQAYKHQNRAFG